jgi:hypothetical protein
MISACYRSLLATVALAAVATMLWSGQRRSAPAD